MKLYTGEVQRGERQGTKLGYPTANIILEDTGVSGIYAARVVIREDEAPYMAAVFADPSRKILEAYLLDFSDTLYGTTIVVELHKKIRASKKFDSEKKLRAAITKDVAKVREYFKN